jgi:hypothetical protein
MEDRADCLFDIFSMLNARHSCEVMELLEQSDF